MVPSLFNLAANKFASIDRNKNDLLPSVMPKEVSETVVPFLKPLELCEYIESCGGIAQIKKSFSTDGFQKFYLHYLGVIHEELHKTTKARFDQLEEEWTKEYPTHLSYERPCKGQGTQVGTVIFVKFIIFDWCLRSLGVFGDLLQYGTVKLERRFFEIKFHMGDMDVPQYAVPKLCNEWKKYLPNDVNTSLLPHIAFPSCSRLLKKENSCIKEQFFCRLLVMVLSYVYATNHEVLAYGFEILGRQDFLQHVKLKHYLLYVYGMVGVTLAKCNVSSEWAMTFVHKAEELAFVTSQKLDVLYYKQRIYKHYCIFDKEHAMAFQMFNHVPSTSPFFVMAYITHAASICKQMDIYLCQVLCLKNAGTYEQNNYAECYQILVTMETMLLKEKRFVYKCLSTNTIHDKHFEQDLVRIELYELCVKILKDNYTPPIEVYYYFQMKCKGDCVLYPIFKYMSNSFAYNIDLCELEIKQCEFRLEREKLLKHSEQFSNVCFKIFLLFHIIVKLPNRARFWLDKCIDLYKNIHSPRSELALMFKNKTTNFLSFNHKLTPKPYDVKKLFQEEKHITHMIQLGIISISKSDILYSND